MKTYTAARSTTASPERVWSLWSDPNNWTSWNTGIKSCVMSGPLVPGAKAVMETAQGGKYDVTFNEVEPPRRYTLSMAGAPGTTFTFICEITPIAAGSTIAQSAAISGPLAFVFGPLIGPQMVKNFVPVLDDLARAAEAAG